MYVRRAVCKTAVTKGEMMAFRETGVISDRSVLVARRRNVGETSNQVKRRRRGLVRRSISMLFMTMTMTMMRMRMIREMARFLGLLSREAG